MLNNTRYKMDFLMNAIHFPLRNLVKHTILHRHMKYYGVFNRHNTKLDTDNNLLFKNNNGKYKTYSL